MTRTKFVHRFAFGWLMVSLAMGELWLAGAVRGQQMPDHMAVPGSVVPKARRRSLRCRCLAWEIRRVKRAYLGNAPLYSPRSKPRRSTASGGQS